MKRAILLSILLTNFAFAGFHDGDGQQGPRVSFNGILTAEDIRGTVVYTLTVPQEGRYTLFFPGSYITPPPCIDCKVAVEGQLIVGAGWQGITDIANIWPTDR